MKWLQIIFAVGAFLAFLVGVLVAVYDGQTVLRLTTPLMMIVFGWVFTAKVTEA